MRPQKVHTKGVHAGLTAKSELYHTLKKAGIPVSWSGSTIVSLQKAVDRLGVKPISFKANREKAILDQLPVDYPFEEPRVPRVKRAAGERDYRCSVTLKFTARVPDNKNPTILISVYREFDVVFIVRSVEMPLRTKVYEIAKLKSFDILKTLSVKNRSDWELDSIVINSIELVTGKKIEDIPNRDITDHLQYGDLKDDLVVNYPGRGTSCTISMLLDIFREAYPSITRTELEEAFPFHDTIGVTPRELCNWVATKKYISCWVLDAFGRTLCKVVASGKVKAVVACLANNGHFYPIMDKAQKDEIARTGKLSFKNMKYSINDWEDYCIVSGEEAIAEFGRAIALPVQKSKIIVIDSPNNCVKDLFDYCTKVTGTVILITSFNSLSMEMFVHPVTSQIIIAGKDALKRKDLVDKIFKLSGYIKLDGFKNQSYSSIGMSYFELLSGPLPPSTYSPDCLEILENYKIGPMICRVRELLDGQSDEGIKSIDMRLSYPSAVEYNVDRYAVFSINDSVKVYHHDDNAEWLAGEYYVPGGVSIPLPGDNPPFTVPGGWIPMPEVKGWYESGLIRKEDITHAIISTESLAADTFQPFIEGTSSFGDDHMKSMSVCLIGGLNQRYDKSCEIATSDSFEYIYALQKTYPDSEIVECGELWCLYLKHKVLKTSGHCFIWRHIISCARLRLAKMCLKVVTKDSLVYGYNTDSVKLTNPDMSCVKLKKSSCKPGDYFLEHGSKIRGLLCIEKPPIRQWVIRESKMLCLKDINAETGIGIKTGMAIVGAAGYGKTQFIKQLYDSISGNLKVQCLSFTNSAVSTMKLRGIDRSSTLDSVLNAEHTFEQQAAVLTGNDVIIIDEFSQICEKHRVIMMLAKVRKPSLRFIIVGDHNQIPGIDKIVVDTYYTHWFRYLVDYQQLNLEYIEASARYDPGLKDFLAYLLEHHTIPPYMKDQPLWDVAEVDHIITSTNATKDRWNRLKAIAFRKAHPDRPVVQLGALKLMSGMPITPKGINIKSDIYPYYNGGQYIFNNADADNVVMTEVQTSRVNTMPRAVYSKVESSRSRGGDDDSNQGTALINSAEHRTEYGFADTAHRCQGKTIPGKINIVETDKMTLHVLYAAASRATKLEDIRIDWTDKVFDPASSFHQGQICRYLTPSYTTGYIYKLIGDGETTIYIGMTTTSLEKRLEQHLAKPTSPLMRELISSQKGGIKIEMYKEYVLIDYNNGVSRELKKIEDHFIQLYQPPGNTAGKAKKPKPLLEATELEVKFTKWVPRHNEVKKIYQVNYMDGNKQVKKEFSYKKCSMEDALSAAKIFQASLMKKAFG